MNMNMKGRFRVVMLHPAYYGEGQQISTMDMQQGFYAYKDFLKLYKRLRKNFGYENYYFRLVSISSPKHPDYYCKGSDLSELVQADLLDLYFKDGNVFNEWVSYE